MNKLFRMLLVLMACIAITFSNGFAQKKGTASSAIGVKVGQKNIGVSLGLWHGIGISINGEMILKDFQELNGVVGVGGEIGYASEKDEWSGFGYKYGWEYTYIPIFGFASFHYRLSDPKIDPYIRIGLGFVYISSNAYGTYSGVWGEANDSYIGIDGQVGVRYAVTPNLWARAAVGTPWILSLGIDFRF